MSAESQDSRYTYLKDLVVLSVLLAGWAPGESFRRLKIASLFFMSLALGEGGRSREEGFVSLAHTTPANLGCKRPWAGARGTYSFIVCRLCRFPLRVRYMPRSISEESPTLCTLRLLPPTRSPGFKQKCRQQRAGARTLCVSGILAGMTGLQARAWAGAQTGGARKWEGPEGGREKQPCRPTLRGFVKGACVRKGRPLGPAPRQRARPSSL